MPSGKTHDSLTFMTCLGAIPILGLLMPQTPESAGSILAAVCAHGVSGFLCSPDLDTDSIVYRRWGILRFVWKPYQYVIPHRSFLSHGVFFGPFIRLLYLGAIWYALVWLVPPLASAMTLWEGWEGRYWALGGWFTGSALHSGSDWLVSRLKGRKRRRTSRRFSH